MSGSVAYSLREAAYVAGLTVDRLEKASERGEVMTVTRTVHGHKVRVVPKRELVLYWYTQEHRNELPKSGWAAVLKQSREKKKHRFNVILSEGRSLALTVAVDLSDVSRRVDEQGQKLRHLREIAKGNDDPMIRGTDIPLYRVAALVGEDGDVSQAKLAFPSLDEAIIRDAVEYARLYPKRGRPYPSQSLKAALSSLDLSEIPFEQSDNEAPREIRI